MDGASPTHGRAAALEPEIESLASGCLSQPWKKTARELGERLPRWQKRIVQGSKEQPLPPGISKPLEKALAMLPAAFQSRNIVVISELLANDFIPVARHLDGRSPGPR